MILNEFKHLHIINKWTHTFKTNWMWIQFNFVLLDDLLNNQVQSCHSLANSYKNWIKSIYSTNFNIQLLIAIGQQTSTQPYLITDLTRIEGTPNYTQLII